MNASTAAVHSDDDAITPVARPRPSPAGVSTRAPPASGGGWPGASPAATATGAPARLHAASAAARAQVDRTHKRMAADRARIDAETDPERRRRMLGQHQRDAARIAGIQAAVADAVARSLVVLAHLPPAQVPEHPPGAFSGLIRCHDSCAVIAGALGQLRCVPWQGEAADAIRLAAAIFIAQTPLRCLRGKPYRHVAHLVISAPHHYGTFPFRWEKDLAVTMARHALRSQGADPDRHDALMVIHSQRCEHGADHDEEAVHVLWSRIDRDGRCLSTPHAFVAAHLGRARWDARAGLDPMRVGIGRLCAQPVRRGYELLGQGRLAASYRDLASREQSAVPLQDIACLAALASEGPPPLGACSGLWTPKPCYRSPAEITRILAHLYQPARTGG